MSSDKVVKETIEFKLNKKPYSVTLFHNINMEQYNWNAILADWVSITEIYTSESLALYINSKSHLTGCRAFTESQYEELKRNQIMKP